MTGEAHWLTPLVLLASAALILLVGYLAHRLGKRYLALRRRFLCPTSGKTVEGTMVRDQKTGEFTAVLSCSALPNPDQVTCNQDCLKTAQENTTG